jgi:hypothetical protein
MAIPPEASPSAKMMANLADFLAPSYSQTEMLQPAIRKIGDFRWFAVPPTFPG